MVHSQKDLASLRIHFSAFDAESAVNNYHWEIYRNVNGFVRTDDGGLHSCTDIHVGNCEQDVERDSDKNPIPLISGNEGIVTLKDPFTQGSTSSPYYYYLQVHAARSQA